MSVNKYDLKERICKCHPNSSCACPKFMIQRNGRDWIAMFSRDKAVKLVTELNGGVYEVR